MAVVDLFGRELAEARHGQALTLRQLGSRAHLSASYLCELEGGRRGSRPSDATIGRLAAALGLSPTAFAVYRARRLVILHPEAVDRLYAEIFADHPRP